MISKWLFLILIFVIPFFCTEASHPICLTLMVKNDEKVIERCLNSVKDVVDCISVCNTGSIDNTLSIITQFCQKFNIPIKIHQNYGHNKTVAAQFAQKTLLDFHFSLPQSYLLVLDSDTVLKKLSKFEKETLTADLYFIAEKSVPQDCYIYKPRLFRASLPWENKSEIYEDWSYTPSHTEEKLDAWMTEDLGDGKNTQTLISELLRHPDNPHHLFNLAQLYRAQKKYTEAIEHYRAYVKKGKNQEEIWFSKFMIGKCYEEIGKWNRAFFWYLNAYQFNPDRTESLKKIATYYRLHGQFNLAYMYAKQGSRIPPANDQIYYEGFPQHHYQFNEELSVAAFYTRFKEDGFSACNDLVLTKNIPLSVKNQTYQNMLFYVQNLKNCRFVPIKLELPFIQEGCEDRYRPMNPSIQKTKDGYKLICRTVNYTQKNAIPESYKTLDSSGIFRTRNFLLQYDQNFNLLSQKEIIEDLPRKRIQYVPIEGLEDCRLFEMHNQWWFTCTTSDTNPTGNRQISLCKLENSASKNAISVEKLIPLLGPDLNLCEKNWLPFVKDKKLHLIYSCHPFTIYCPHLETGENTTRLTYEPSHDFSRFRGSAAPIEFDQGYLMLVHETIYFEDKHRSYLHRFVYLDENFNITQLSKPFTFQHQGIEFACNMTIDHSGKNLIIPIGVEDREAYLCFLDLETVRSLLYKLDNKIFKTIDFSSY